MHQGSEIKGFGALDTYTTGSVLKEHSRTAQRIAWFPYDRSDRLRMGCLCNTFNSAPRGSMKKKLINTNNKHNSLNLSDPLHVFLSNYPCH